MIGLALRACHPLNSTSVNLDAEKVLTQPIVATRYCPNCEAVNGVEHKPGCPTGEALRDYMISARGGSARQMVQDLKEREDAKRFASDHPVMLTEQALRGIIERLVLLEREVAKLNDTSVRYPVFGTVVDKLARRIGALEP